MWMQKKYKRNTLFLTPPIVHPSNKSGWISTLNLLGKSTTLFTTKNNNFLTQISDNNKIMISIFCTLVQFIGAMTSQAKPSRDWSADSLPHDVTEVKPHTCVCVFLSIIPVCLAYGCTRSVHKGCTTFHRWFRNVITRYRSLEHKWNRRLIVPAYTRLSPFPSFFYYYLLFLHPGPQRL